MVKGIVINPSLPEPMMFKSAEEVCTFLSSDKDTHLPPHDIESDSDYITAINLHHYTDQIGDTVKIYQDRGGNVFKMVFMDFEGDAAQRPTYNLLASILHHEGRKIYGKAVVVRMSSSNEALDCSDDDVLNILYRRAWHTGLWFKDGQDSPPQEVEIDNRWIVKGEDGLCISEWAKVQCHDIEGNLLLKVSKGDEYFLFSLLEDRMLIDLYIQTFKGLR